MYENAVTQLVGVYKSPTKVKYGLFDRKLSTNQVILAMQNYSINIIDIMTGNDCT